MARRAPGAAARLRLLCSLVALPSLTSASATSSRVPRLDARTLSRTQLHARLRQGPVVLTSAFQDARGAARWADELLDAAGAAEVEFQVRSADAGVQLHRARLGEVCDLALESSHERSLVLFDEQLVPAAAPRLHASGALALRAELFEPDWFAHFPPRLRPQGCCVVLTGEGGRSTLHADPFEWVGTNAALEGAKLWRFLPPHAGAEEAARLGTYRLPSIAWGDEGASLSAGWQSDHDLFARRSPRAPRARSLHELEGVQAGGEEGAGGAAAAAGGASALSDALETLADPASGLLLPDTRLPSAALEGARSCVQRAGELVLIPPRWWHQTYSPMPAIAVAGQYCDSFCRDDVFQHVLDWAGVGGVCARQVGSPGMSPAEQVAELLHAVGTADARAGAAPAPPAGRAS